MMSKTLVLAARSLILCAISAFSVPAVCAPAPPANGDDLDVTMRTITNPDAIEPDEIVRKIPARKPRKSAQDDDDPANDLAAPNAGGPAAEPDPGIPDSGTPDPGIPGPDPALPGPDVGGIPDEVGPGAGPAPREHPDNLGHRVSDDARHHGRDSHRNAHVPHAPRNDKPPRTPDTKPPGPKNPGVKPPRPKPPGAKPPGTKPPGSKPPGPKPPGAKPPGPKPPGGKPPGHGPGPRG